MTIVCSAEGVLYSIMHVKMVYYQLNYIALEFKKKYFEAGSPNVAQAGLKVSSPCFNLLSSWVATTAAIPGLGSSVE